jgi:hypothetical protein
MGTDTPGTGQHLLLRGDTGWQGADYGDEGEDSVITIDHTYESSDELHADLQASLMLWTVYHRIESETAEFICEGLDMLITSIVDELLDRGEL